MSPFLWLVVGNGLLPSGVFCYVTINLTKVGSSKWCCCIVSFSTCNRSISQVIPNKQVMEQMTKNERFILHQSMKTDAVCSFSHQEEQTLLQNHISGTKHTQLIPWSFALHRHHENNWTLEGETQIWKNVKLCLCRFCSLSIQKTKMFLCFQRASCPWFHWFQHLAHMALGFRFMQGQVYTAQRMATIV